MKIDDLISLLRELKVEFMVEDVQILVGNTKFEISQVYLENYSDFTYKAVIEGNFND